MKRLLLVILSLLSINNLLFAQSDEYLLKTSPDLHSIRAVDVYSLNKRNKVVKYGDILLSHIQLSKENGKVYLTLNLMLCPEYGWWFSKPTVSISVNGGQYKYLDTSLIPEKITKLSYYTARIEAKDIVNFYSVDSAKDIKVSVRFGLEQIDDLGTRTFNIINGSGLVNFNVGMGDWYMALGKDKDYYAKALTYYQKALKERVRGVDLYTNMARCYEESEMYIAAIDCLNEALTISKSEETPEFNLTVQQHHQV